MAAESVLNKCKQYGLDLYIIPVWDCIKTDLTLPAMNCIPPVSKEALEKFNARWQRCPSTSWNDMIVKLKRNILIKVANALQCNYILTAETTTTLASNLLSNLAMGRGSQIEHDIGFLDSRNDFIKILRPMKDISQDEVFYYGLLKKLTYFENTKVGDNSLQSLITTFVVELQKNFPATISTICRTAEKIGTYGDITKLNKCYFCQVCIRNFKCRFRSRTEKRLAVEVKLYSLYKVIGGSYVVKIQNKIL